jgi:hypothetical protein
MPHRSATLLAALLAILLITGCIIEQSAQKSRPVLHRTAS